MNPVRVSLNNRKPRAAPSGILREVAAPGGRANVSMTSRPDTARILITHRCPRQDCRARIRTPGDRIGRLEAACPACGEAVVLDVDAALKERRAVHQCALCPGREFFIRKDFPQRLGLVAVILAGLVASVFFYGENIPATFATLGVLVLIDAGIYLLVGRVTVCYRCRAEYRGVAYNSDHQGFDLATSEKYK